LTAKSLKGEPHLAKVALKFNSISTEATFYSPTSLHFHDHNNNLGRWTINLRACAGRAPGELELYFEALEVFRNQNRWVLDDNTVVAFKKLSDSARLLIKSMAIL
jgi:hypothetical protein